MKIEIKNRLDGSIIFEGEFESLLLAVEDAIKKNSNLSGANLYRADLSGADLSGANLYRANLYRANLSGADLYRANLYGANLSGADLSGANLYRADLSGANLYRANLYGADLSGANLYGAGGVDRNRTQPLMMLLDQPGPIRAYKIVTSDLCSPIAPGNGYRKLTYEIGSTLSVDNCNEDPNDDCGAGLHVATLSWCLSERIGDQRILVVEFSAADIACIPCDASGKFRVRRLTVIGEKEIPEVSP